MRRKKRNPLYLILSTLSLLSLIGIVVFLKPTATISLGFVAIPFIWLFFIPLVIFAFSTPSFLLKSRKHGVLIAIFVTSFFLFRLFHLTHPLFLVLLLGLFLTLELLFTSKHV
ncbi:MAG: hypothetical protein AAB478_01555 [Patescibacteria group bacterium]